ncbi:ATP-binding cassette domain-containing protein [Streptomyces enissocaesilis]|uniref:ABC transporter domain-containing protein n=1 Tax=Streptomyces enissocaesilis TaxID=332589 RepID=A0ABN3X7E6_9ACTN
MEVRDVHHAYDRREVLRGLELDLRPGVLTGIVGENGAGKSTLLRILSGELRPHRGTVRHGGRFGYCPQDAVVDEALTVRQHLEFFRVARGLPDLRHAGEVMEALRLTEYTDERAGLLGGGTRQNDRDRLATVFRGGTDPVTAHRDLLTVLTRTGALTKAARMASTYAEQACAELTSLTTPHQFTELAASAADRQR